MCLQSCKEVGTWRSEGGKQVLNRSKMRVDKYVVPECLITGELCHAETVILTWNACHSGMIAYHNSAGRWYSVTKSLSKWHALRVIMT